MGITYGPVSYSTEERQVSAKQPAGGGSPGTAHEGLELSEDEVPEFVFVPAERVTGGISPDTRVELRAVAGGGLALLTYSSPERLAENCGPHQPWVAFPGARVEELRQQTGADVAVLDAPLEPALWHGGAE